MSLTPAVTTCPLHREKLSTGASVVLYEHAEDRIEVPRVLEVWPRSPGPLAHLTAPCHQAWLVLPHSACLRPFPAEGLRAPRNCCVPSPQRGLQKSVARTIALSFLFPKTDQPWRPFERAVITSSFVSNGISLTHGGAWGRGGNWQGCL